MLIQERDISDRIHAAFAMEPLPGGFDRLRIVLDSARAERRKPTRTRLVREWAPLVAGLIASLIAASAIAYGIETRAVPTKNPPPVGVARGILGYWSYSADDAAVQLEPTQGGKAYVLITHDAGRTWLRTTLHSDLIGIRWIDSMHLLAMGNNVGPPFLFASSSDGGATWRETQLPNHWNLATFFLNETEGWALCNRFRACIDGQQKTLLYHSVDSGATWQQISTVIDSPSITPLGVFFVDRNRGFISTMNSSGIATLLTTIDGGITWRVADLPVPAASPASYAVDCGQPACVETPTMFGSRGVVVVQHAYLGVFTYTTTDGGATWGNREPAPVGDGFVSPVLAPLDPLTWWAVDSGGNLYRTDDAGSSWRLVPTVVPDGRKLQSVTGTAGGVLWGATVQAGAADHQYPVRSTDDGTTWSIVKLPKN